MNKIRNISDSGWHTKNIYRNAKKCMFIIPCAI